MIIGYLDPGGSQRSHPIANVPHQIREIVLTAVSVVKWMCLLYSLLKGALGSLGLDPKPTDLTLQTLPTL